MKEKMVERKREKKERGEYKERRERRKKEENIKREERREIRCCEEIHSPASRVTRGTSARWTAARASPAPWIRCRLCECAVSGASYCSFGDLCVLSGGAGVCYVLCALCFVLRCTCHVVASTGAGAAV